MFSTLPFAVGLVASVHYAATGFSNWLMWWLWISYGLGVYGFFACVVDSVFIGEG